MHLPRNLLMAALLCAANFTTQARAETVNLTFLLTNDIYNVEDAERGGFARLNAVVKAELFPVEVRALGVGLPFAVTVSLFGGTAEYIALWFKQAGNEQGFYWYVTACIGCSLLVYVLMPDTQRESQIDRD